MTMEAAIIKFIESLQLKNYTKATILSRNEELKRFLVYCKIENIKLVDDLNEQNISQYQLEVKQRYLAVTTKIHYLVVVKQLCFFLYENNFLLMNYSKLLYIPKREKRIPRNIFSLDEIKSMIALPNLSKNKGLRDRAILELFYSCGLRRSELCHLKVFDIDFIKSLIFVRSGKGRKDRLIPVGQRALSWLKKYLEHARVNLIDHRHDNFVFLSTRGGALRIESMKNLIRIYKIRAGIEKHGACHLFRHSMVTHMLENGADIRYIQEMLGHSCLDSTVIYTKVEIGHLQKVINQYHPLG